MSLFGISIFIFIISYVLIISEKFDKTMVALGGGTLGIILKIISEEKAFHYIEYEVLYLLIGMMIIVSILSKTGVFEWTAIQVAIYSKGEPVRILLFLCVVTAVFSAFLDNVTTMILISPVIMIISQMLSINPIPFLLTGTLSSNLGGTATLIGDPPNILIGNAAKLTFNQFLYHLSPVVIILIFIYLFLFYFIYKKEFQVSRDVKARVLSLKPEKAIQDMALLKKCIVVLSFVFIGFATHSITHYGLSTISLFGASVLCIIAKIHSDDVFKHVEWDTLFFFIGLFLLIATLDANHVIDYLAGIIITLVQGSITITAIALIWISGILSCFIGAVPYCIAMIPVVKQIIEELVKSGQLNPETVQFAIWWSFALGTCLGANGSIYGSPANVVVSGLASKNGHPISYYKFFKIGFPIMIISLAVSSVYIYYRYLTVLQ